MNFFKKVKTSFVQKSKDLSGLIIGALLFFAVPYVWDMTGAFPDILRYPILIIVGILFFSIMDALKKDDEV